MNDRSEYVRSKQKRKAALWTERSSYDPQWKDLARFVLPNTGRWMASDRNQGKKKHQYVIDAAGTDALDILVAGLMSGASSPARQWMRLSAPVPEMADEPEVKTWLHITTQRMLRVFSLSNTYRALPKYYRETALYGTAAGFIERDPRTVIHHHSLTAGQYAIAVDGRDRVNTVVRELEMTAAQMVGEFGIDKVSRSVREQYERKNYEATFTVCHMVQPRHMRNPRKADQANMPFESCYWEDGKSEVPDVLREGGYQRFPAVAPRWDTVGGDVYGTGVGAKGIGAIQQLQHLHIRKAQVVDQRTDPAKQGPPEFKTRELEQQPGGFNPVSDPSRKIEPIYVPDLDYGACLEEIRDIRERIQRNFYADLFLMLATADKAMTATEVAERHEEKLLMLGPVLERLHHELLEPMVDITFEHMLEMGLVPEPPDVLRGQQIGVEFVSMLAQAQRAVTASTDDRFLGWVQGLSQSRPEVWDKVNLDEAIDDYSDKLGINPKWVIPTPKANEQRQARNQAMAAQAAMEAQATQAGAARDVAAATKDAPDVMQQLTGYGAP